MNDDPELRKFFQTRMNTAEAAKKAGDQAEAPAVHRYPPSIDDIAIGGHDIAISGLEPDTGLEPGGGLEPCRIYFPRSPRWWVRIVATIAQTLWKYHLPALSWGIADACLWLQTKTPKRKVS
jgi:hypothetical protein